MGNQKFMGTKVDSKVHGKKCRGVKNPLSYTSPARFVRVLNVMQLLVLELPEDYKLTYLLAVLTQANLSTRYSMRVSRGK